MRLYKLDKRTYVNLDAVQFGETNALGKVALHLADGSQLPISPSDWEKIKTQYTVTL